jgi:predicted DNA-binding transcriptional regulator AlpA
MSNCRLFVVHEGPRGRVVAYERPNGRCPAYSFLRATPANLLQRFQRSFVRFADSGYAIAANNVFKPNTEEGRGIWSWKEHDHRLLSFRAPDLASGKQVNVLLTGWVKDKTISLEERNQFLAAQELRREYEACEHRSAIYGSWLGGSWLGLPLTEAEPVGTPTAVVWSDPVPDTSVVVLDPTPDPLLQEPIHETARGEAPVQEEEPMTEPTTTTTPTTTTEKKEGPVSYFEVCCLAEVPYKWALRNASEEKLLKPSVRTMNGRTVYAVSYDALDMYVQEMRTLRSRSGKSFGKQESTESAFVPFDKVELHAAVQKHISPNLKAPKRRMIFTDLVRPGTDWITFREARTLTGRSYCALRSASCRGRLGEVGYDRMRNRVLYHRGDVLYWHNATARASAAVAKPATANKSPKLDLVRFPKGKVPQGFIDAKAAARLYGASVSTVWSATYRGRLPVAGQEIGTSRKFYRRIDVEAWIATYKPEPGTTRAKQAATLHATLAKKAKVKQATKQEAKIVKKSTTEIPATPVQVPGRTDLHKLLDAVLAERKPVSMLTEAVEKHVKARKTIRELQSFLAEYKKNLA